MARVIGFDPGTATTGYGVVESKGSRLLHVAHGAITTPPGEAFETRLIMLYDGVQALLEEFRPDSTAIEKLFFKQNITTGISVAQARGVIALAIAQRGLPIGEFAPVEVKNGVVGYGKATKQQVQDMVKILLNLDGRPKPDDAADGLAVAICQLRMPVIPLPR